MTMNIFSGVCTHLWELEHVGCCQNKLAIILRHFDGTFVDEVENSFEYVWVFDFVQNGFIGLCFFEIHAVHSLQERRMVE